MDILKSKTIEALMRAYAGECQSRVRYEFSAEQAGKQQHFAVQAVFKFTAKQELAHAKVFYDMIKGSGVQKIRVGGDFPICSETDILQLLRCAQSDESEEHSKVYNDFAETAQSEGFEDIADKFRLVGNVEKTHAERFKVFAELLEQNKLYVSDVQEQWVCLNCGHVLSGEQAPMTCPLCGHPQGYFIRASLAPYSR